MSVDEVKGGDGSMGFFSELFGGNKSKNEKVSNRYETTEKVIDTMLKTAEVAMDSEDYSLAVETYKDILKLESNAIAQYNLGSLYAQGKGVGQDFRESAYWFRQAELSGDEQAGKLCLKCTLDFIHKNFDIKNSEQLYEDMVDFIGYVYSDTVNINLEVCRTLYAVAGNHFNKQEYSHAAKLFRAAGEFGNDGYSQNYLAVLYNLGKGLEQNDLVALYWFDKATDNGAADLALQDRDGLLNTYKENFPPDKFSEIMFKLAEWCEKGSSDVPKDISKSVYWRKIGERKAAEL